MSQQSAECVGIICKEDEIFIMFKRTSPESLQGRLFTKLKSDYVTSTVKKTSEHSCNRLMRYPWLYYLSCPRRGSGHSKYN
jgi:hypothetical protein